MSDIVSSLNVFALIIIELMTFPYRRLKAMRLMGNNSLSIGNGPLKATTATSSAVSISQKSITNTFMGRSMNTNKKVTQRRLFFKNGNINISRSNIEKRRRRYLTDIFTTLIDLKWRYNIIVFLLGFFVSWMFFALAWYLISYLHGDLDPLTLASSNHTSCISGIHGFAGAILFSIETQQTIGYGVRYTTEKCPEAIFVMMIQSSVGVMIQSFMVRLFYLFYNPIFIFRWIYVFPKIGRCCIRQVVKAEKTQRDAHVL